MRFTLSYKGVIPTKEYNKLKHDIRLEFDKQLMNLLKIPPLKKHPEWFKMPYPEELYKKVGNNDFIHLVTNKLNMFVNLKIQIYSKYRNRSFKDIDNKLKIIFDALQVPREKKNIPSSWNSKLNDRPILCLLSDDRLIYSLKVDTDYILDTNLLKTEELFVIIKVEIKSNVFNSKFADLFV